MEPLSKKQKPIETIIFKISGAFFFFFPQNSGFKRRDKSSTKCQDRHSVTIAQYYPEKGYLKVLALEQFLLLLKVIDIFSNRFHWNKIGPF